MSNLSVYDELDQAIDQLILPHNAVPASLKNGGLLPDVAQLVEVASDLRDLPRPDFKMRLKLELDWQASGRLVGDGQGFADSRNSWARAKTEILPSLLGAGSIYPHRGAHFAASVGLHATMALLVSLVILLSAKAPQVSQEKATPVLLDSAYTAPARPNGGSSGGGNRETTDASQGALPPSSLQQLTPPMVIPPQESRLHVQPAIVAPDLNLPKPDQMGDPLSSLMAPSSGRGTHGGIGDGECCGVGHTSGNSYGLNGRGGSGISAPRVIYSPEPDFSEEARKVKHQGTVMLWAIIGTDGRPRNIRVQRSLGMGLDEKAIEAFRTWRFQPGMKDGHPVAVEVSVEVNFHLF